MSTLNQNWNRWIFASISKHFDDRRQGLKLFIEGQSRDTSKVKDFIELRVDGPQFTEVSAGYWIIRVEVNILIQSTMDDTNYHRLHSDVGIVAAAMSDIVVFRYGNGPDDDQSVMGCLKVRQDLGDRQHIDVFQLGQIAPDIRLEQATVEGHYEMEYTGV